MKDEIGLKANVTVLLNDIPVRKGHNLIVDGGYSLVANTLLGGAIPSHVAIGDSGSLTTSGMTALQGEELMREALTSSYVSSATYTLESIFSSNTTILNVKEFGIFNDSTSGTMLARFTGPGIVFNPSDELKVVWSITVGSG